MSQHVNVRDEDANEYPGYRLKGSSFSIHFVSYCFGHYRSEGITKKCKKLAREKIRNYDVNYQNGHPHF